MKAVFNTGATSCLADSLGNTAWCLVPMGGKPLIEYWIEYAAKLGICELWLVLGDGAYEIESYCGDGSRWGVKITYGFLKPSSDPESFLRRNPKKWEEGVFYIAAPVFPRYMKPADDNLREQALQSEKNKGSWAFPDQSGNIVCFMSSDKAVIRTFTNGNHPENLRDWSDIGIEPVLIKDIATYYELNMRLVQSEIARYVPPGFGGGDGAYIGSNVIIPPSVELHPPLIIGNNCRIHPMAEIGPNAVIGNNVIVDRQTELSGSVVMDNTYLGRNLEIKNRVVCGSRLITPADATVMDIDDPWLLAPLGMTTWAIDIPRAIGGWLGAVIIILLQAVPFAILYPLLRSCQTGSFLFSSKLITKSRIRNLPYWNATKESSKLNGIFTGLSLDLFPLIALAALGRLWLCGHAPRHPERDAEQLRQLKRYYPAAIGYHSMQIGQTERMTAASEALYYQRYHSLFEDIRVVVRVLLGRLLMRLS